MPDMSYTWYVYEICLGYVWDIVEELRYALNTPRIKYDWHVWDVLEICLKYAWDMFEICLRYT